MDGSKIRKLCEELAIKKVRSSTYHPAGNGSAERAIGFLKTILRSMCLSRNIDINRWDEILPEAILHFNNTQNSSTKFSPFEVAYGMPANLIIDNKLGVNTNATAVDPNLVRQNINVNRSDARASYQKQANKSTRMNHYNVGDLVLLKRTHGAHPKMNPYWVGPFEVIKRVGPVNWGILDQNSGKSKVVHHDLLKPALSKQDALITPGEKLMAETPRVSKLHIRSTNNVSSIAADVDNSVQIDRTQFTNNVFSNPNLSSHSILDSYPVGQTTTRSGRTSRPVIGSRLIDEFG